MGAVVTLVAAVLLFQLKPHPHPAYAVAPQDGAVLNFPTTDTTVNGIVNAEVLSADGSTLYVGGAFTSLGTVTGGFAKTAAADGARSASGAPLLGGFGGSSVDAIVSDGSGGLYLGGKFNFGSNYGLAHIRSDGTLDPNFNFLFNAAVKALALSGSTLYVGGNFNSFDGGTTIRNRLMAINTTTNTATSWNPNVGIDATAVNALALSSDGATLYVGGTFTTVNGATTRNRLAAISTSTGTVTSWDPNVGTTAVNALALSSDGSTLYVGGDFTTVNGATTRNRLAALSTSTGTATSWDPNVGNTVYALTLSGTTLYAAGAFTTVNVSTIRNNAAGIDTSTGTATAYDPNLNATASSVAVSGSSVYLGGAFSLANRITRNRLAAITVATGTVTSWNPNIGTTAVNALALSSDGATLYVGGAFTTVNGATTRNRLAAISTSTGTATSWNPNVGTTAVNALVLSGTTLYVGGAFTTVNGSTTRNRLAAISTSTGTVTSWNPNVGTTAVNALALSSDGATLYVGGAFTTVNGSTTRNRLAAISTSTGTATSWNPNMNSTVNSVTLSSDGATLYVGGAFTTVNGATTRNYVAAISTSTGTATSWNPTGLPDATVVTLVLSPDGATLYAGGNLYGGIACFNTSSAAITCGNGNPFSNGAVNAIAASADGVRLYFGGSFTTGGTSFSFGGLAAFGPTPTVQFTASSASAAESVTSPSLALTLSAASDSSVTVTYEVTGGTATGEGTDYTLASGTATILAGATTVSTPFTVADDTLDEPDETIVVTLLGPTNATLGATTAHTYTILDNDAAPSVQFASASGSGLESVTSPTLTVQLSAASGQTVTAAYAVTGGTATGGGTDYTLASGTATISAGSTSTTLPLTVVNDALDENDETVVVTLSNPSNATLGSTTTHTYTITDDDPTPTVAFTSAISSGSEATTPASLGVSLSAASSFTVTMDYAVTGGTATGGGTDYTLASGTATVTAGSTSTTIPFTVVNDTLDETDETIIVTISTPTNATLGATTAHTYTITDNDPTPTVQFSASTGSGSEGTTSVSIGVALSAASSQTVTVGYAVTGGTATGGGTDYTLATGTLTIAAGSTSGTVALSIADDAVVENNETIVVTLSNPTNSTLGSSTTFTYTITENDVVPDLAVETTDGVDTARPNDRLTYTLTVTNRGVLSASGVTLTGTVPVGATLVSASDGGALSGSTVTWPPVTLAGGASATRTLVVTVDNPVRVAQETLTQTATVADDGSQGADPEPTSNTATDTTALGATPVLQVVAKDGQDHSRAGGALTLALVYSNVGDQDAANVRVGFTVPPHSRLISTTRTWACSPNRNAGSTCTTAVGNVAAGRSARVTFTFRFGADLPLATHRITVRARVAEEGGPVDFRTVRIGTREYVAQRGDSLWSIATRAYGNGADWVHIVFANRRTFPGLAKNPSTIYPGWKLVIPAR